MADPWWRRVGRWAASGSAGPRVAGLPTSSNGASSLHLGWTFANGAPQAASVSVTIEVIEPPSVDRLYFWALQADFCDARGRRSGGAHLGLQWHPGHPGSTAVNWGGYDERGQVLRGSDSALPSALGNPHTRDLAWTSHTPYRLTIEPAPDVGPSDSAAWRGSLRNLSTGERTVVRDLYPSGDRILGVTMWSEVFARCDDPPAAVRWSDAEVVTVDGTRIRPAGFVVNYQSDHDGGCANSDTSPDDEPVGDGVGIVQRTGVTRRTLQGAVLRAPS